MNRHLYFILICIFISSCSTSLVNFENASLVEYSDSEKSLYLGDKSCTLFNFAELSMKDYQSKVDSSFISLSEDYNINLKVISCDVLPGDLVNSIQKSLTFAKEIDKDDIEELYKFIDTDIVIINYLNDFKSQVNDYVNIPSLHGGSDTIIYWASGMKSRVNLFDRDLQLRQIDLLQATVVNSSKNIEDIYFSDYYLISYLLHYYIEPYFANNLSEYSIPQNQLSTIFKVYKKILQIEFLKKENKKYPKEIYLLINDKELQENSEFYNYLIEIGLMDKIEKYYVVDQQADKKHAIFFNIQNLNTYLDNIYTSG